MIEVAMFQSNDIAKLEETINDFFSASLYVDQESIISIKQSQHNKFVTLTILYEKPT